MKKKKKLFSIIVSLTLLLNLVLPSVASAQELFKEKVTISVERRVLGQVDIIKSKEISIDKDELASSVLDKVLKESNITYKNTGNVDSGFYLSSMDANGESIGEFGHGHLSGWMYSVNGVMPNVGMSEYKLKEGDVFRVHYTAKDFGEDIKAVDNIYEVRNLIKEIEKLNKDDYTNDSWNKLQESIKDVKNSIPSDEEIGKMMSDKLGKGDCDTTNLQGEMSNYIELLKESKNSLQESIKISEQEAVNKSVNWTLSKIENPTYNNEWNILGLARSGAKVPQNYFEKYYKNLEKIVVDKKGDLHNSKYTEYSRVILALNSIGKDPTNVGGYNLVEKLYDYDKISKQGINGIIFALIALDSKNYEIPKDQTNSRDKMIEEIINRQKTDGGFALSGSTGDVDITAMTIQALSNYKDQDKVKKSIDKAINFLSASQKEKGGFDSWGTANVESAIQVLIALNSLKIDINDSRFLKEKNTIVSNIMTFINEDGGFKHKVDDKDSNAMSTEQALYGLASHQRYLNNKNKLYDMTDVNDKDESNIDKSIEKSIKYYSKEQNNLQQWWDMVASLSLGEDITKSPYTLSEYSKEAVHQNTDAINDAGTIIGILSQGYDIKNYKEKDNNLAKILADKQQKDGSFGPINYTIWAMLALEMSNQDYNRDLGINYLMDQQKKDGGFSLFGGDGDVDITGMALLTLSFFKGDNKVDESIKKSVEFLDKVQLENGNFDSWGNINSNSLAVAIMGIVSVGENINDARWNNAVDALISYQFQDGSYEGQFKWLQSNDGPNSMATQQCVIALGDAKDGKSIWTEIAERYDEIEKNKNEKPTINASDATIKVGDKFDAMKYATAHDKEDGKINPSYEIVDENKVLKNEIATKTGKFKVKYIAKDSKDATIAKEITVTVIEKDNGGESTNPSKPNPPSSGGGNEEIEKPYLIENKLIGNTRYSTAVKISNEGWNKAENIVIVNSSAMSDALSATPFAKAKDAPILLTEKDSLNDETKTEIIRLKAKNISIIGGTSVVSESVVSQLKSMGVNVNRISGDDRYMTSLEIAKKLGNTSKVSVVNGITGLPDAVSIAPVAASENMPILLVSPTQGTKSFDEFIKTNGIKTSYVIGGENAISSEIEAKLPNAKRLAGKDRNETNSVILENFYTSKELNNVFIAKDGMKKQDDLIDALAVGVLASKQSSPIMIVGNNLNIKQEKLLSTKNSKEVTQVGGNGNESAFNQVVKILKK